MNHVSLIGRLTADPEIINGGNDTLIARYTLAVDKPGKEEANFIRCVAFNKGAEFVESYLFKGMKIGVVGSLNISTYEKEGMKLSSTEVIVQGHDFCEKKEEASKGGWKYDKKRK